MLKLTIAYDYIDEASSYIDSLNLGNPIAFGSFSYVFNFDIDNVLYLTIEKDKEYYLKELYFYYGFDISVIHYEHNILGFILPKLKPINLRKDSIQAIYYMNKELNNISLPTFENAISYYENFLKKYNIKKTKKDEKIIESIKHSFFILKYKNLKFLKYDFKLSQFLKYKDNIICVDPVIFF